MAPQAAIVRLGHRATLGFSRQAAEQTDLTTHPRQRTRNLVVFFIFVEQVQMIGRTWKAQTAAIRGIGQLTQLVLFMAAVLVRTHIQTAVMLILEAPASTLAQAETF